MAATVRMFAVIFWKDLLVRRQHWFATLVEILVPVILFVILVIPKGEDIYYYSKPKVYQAPSTEETLVRALNRRIKLLYTPNNSFTTDLMNRFVSTLQGYSFVNVTDLMPCNDENEMESQQPQQSRPRLYHIFGIIFEGDFSEGIIPERLSYRIRHLFWRWQDFFGPYSYGIGALQLMIDKTYIQMRANNTNLPFKVFRDLCGRTEDVAYALRVQLQKFPQPPYVNNPYNFYRPEILLAPMVVTSFLVLLQAVIRRIVVEKETGVKELMKMMGLKPWQLWLSWLLNALSTTIISITIIVILLTVNLRSIKYGAFISFTNGFTLWLFLFFYAMAGSMFCFAISSFFTNRTFGVVSGITFWITTYVVPAYCLYLDKLSFAEKMFLGLLPNMAVLWGIEAINFREILGGMRLDYLYQYNNLTLLSLGYVFLLFIIDIILYGSITWYVDSIKPGKYGVAKPWNFFLECFPCIRKKTQTDYHHFTNIVENSKYFETEDSQRKVGIKLQDLRKTFTTRGGGTVLAVNGVSLNIYEGEITVLLGHNGAGKTTTMSILSGSLSSSGGTVIINGQNIEHNIDSIREKIGFCPQHNMLFDYLTVEQHLLLFALLKGRSLGAARGETKNLLAELDLTEKASSLASNLSGGMKRKLCLGIALIGDSKIVILDEPTTGLDPEARRRVWDMLLGMRGQRTIILTTHSMEEADTLGDRVAIMSYGQVLCYGSPMFLKKLYGTGYDLKITRKTSCDVNNLTENIRRIIPESERKSDVTSMELTFLLPSNQLEKFPQLLQYLEDGKEEIGIAGIGISITTMEEVFLRAGETKEVGDTNGGERTLEDERDICCEKDTYHEHESSSKVSGLKLEFQRYKAVLRKKMQYTYRRRFTFGTMIGALLLWIILMVLMSTHYPRMSNEKVLIKSSIEMLKDSYVLYESRSLDEDGPAKYYHQFLKQFVHIEFSSNVTKDLLKRAEENKYDFWRRFRIAANFANPTTITALVSPYNWESPTILSLNLMSNALLQYSTGNRNTSITTTVDYIKRTNEFYLWNNFISIRRAIMWLFMIPIGMLMFIAHYVSLPLLERVSKVKQLQLMTGTSRFVYWCATFTWDIFTILLSVF